ncbi:MAG: hypothetical protein V4445_09205 [Pseudomonadota bacterium]
MTKLNELEATTRQNSIDYLNQRWKQLYELDKEWAEQAWKYLFLTNSGGAVAMLSFLGAYKENSHIIFLKAALVCFVIGVFLVGICIARMFHHINNIFKLYRVDANKFLTGEICWMDLTKNDEDRTSPSPCKKFWNNFWPYSSFFCFIIGSSLGAVALF